MIYGTKSHYVLKELVMTGPSNCTGFFLPSHNYNMMSRVRLVIDWRC